MKNQASLVLTDSRARVYLSPRWRAIVFPTFTHLKLGKAFILICRCFFFLFQLFSETISRACRTCAHHTYWQAVWMIGIRFLVRAGATIKARMHRKSDALIPVCHLSAERCPAPPIKRQSQWNKNQLYWGGLAVVFYCVTVDTSVGESLVFVTVKSNFARQRQPELPV